MKCQKIMNKKGIAAIELVLVLPVLLPILFGIVEYGWVFKTQIDLNNAVSEGASAVIKGEGSSSTPVTRMNIAKVAVREAVGTKYPNLENYISSPIRLDDGSPPLPRASVALTNWTHTSLTGFLDALLPSALSAKAVMAFP